MKISKQLDPKLKYEFYEVRDFARGHCFVDIWERLIEHKRFKPTEEEARMNTVWELIEPQVKDAVKELNKKGYCTTDSGFMGRQYQKQFIAGVFKLDEFTIRLLKSKDISVTEDGRWTYIEFIAKNPDLDEIKQTWDEVIALIPDLGHTAKSRDEIIPFNEDKIMQKLFELGKITEKDYKTFKKNKNRVQKKPRRG